MKLKVYFENQESTMGGWEIVPLYRLVWWLFLGHIKPKENSTRYFIRKIETIEGRRI